MRTWLAAWACLMLSVYVGATDFSKVRFEYITVEDGLSQGIVQDIFQDSRGFIWIATRNGLNLYDGNHFVVYHHERTRPNSLAANFIYCVTEDSSGNIWIGSNGLNKYNPRSGEMTRIAVDAGNDKAFQGGWVYNIAVDHDHSVWLATSNGLVHYNPENNTFKTYTHDAQNPQSLASNIVYDVLISADNRLFVAADADPVFEYDRKADSFKPMVYKQRYLGNNTFKHLYENEGLLYITSENAGLHIYNLLTGLATIIDASPDGLNANTIRSLLFAAKDEIWLGTDGGGINIYNPLNGTFAYLQYDTKTDQALNSNTVYALLQDKDRNVWAGHFGNGLSIWKRNKEKFTSFRHNPLNPQTINKEIVSAIFEDSQGRLWVGQDGGGLSRFIDSTGQFIHFRHNKYDPASLRSDVILAIQEDPSGNLLLGTYAAGMMVFDPETGSIVSTYTMSDGLPSNDIWQILVDASNRYWILTLRGGLTRFDPDLKTFTNYLPEIGSNSKNAVDFMTMAEDPRGNLWLGTDDKGIYVFSPDEGKFIKHYQNEEKNLNSISDNSIRSIFFSENFAWIATNGGGLNRLHLDSDSIRVYTVREGLSSNAIMGILTDSQGYLWISSARGLMKFDQITSMVVKYDRSHGIQGSEFKYNSQYLLADSSMAFGGVSGLTVFHPGQVKSSAIIPPLVLTGFKINNTSIKPGQKHSPLKNTIDYSESITLKHNQNNLTFEFASLDFTSPGSNLYQYKMQGVDDNWIDAGNTTSVTYTGLRPGRYNFMVKGSNSDGVWNEHYRQVKIRVTPPWYKTWVAYLFYLLTVASTALFAYKRQRERREIADNNLLQQKINNAEAQLSARLEELELQKEEIKRRDQQEKDIRFLTNGIAKFSDIIAKSRQNLNQLATHVIKELVDYVGASAGEIFVLDETDPNHPQLMVMGDYLMSSEKERIYRFDVGEGLPGACFAEKKIQHIDNIPEGFILLKSGLGKVSLKHLALVPLIQDEICIGVIEIASLDKLTENKIAFIEKIAESISSVIAIIRANEKTNALVEQINAQTEELMSQEEEMRQNMEEMMATQEESQRREQELSQKLEESRAETAEQRELVAKLTEKLGLPEKAN